MQELMIDIQVNGLVKSFEVGHNVLDGLTFQIDQGERVGLLGKNGAGKTTLFKILTGELDYDEGQVTIATGPAAGPDLPDPRLSRWIYRGGCAAHRLFPPADAGRGDARRWRAAWRRGTATRPSCGATAALSEKFEAFGGYDTDVAVNKIAGRPLHFPGNARTAV